MWEEIGCHLCNGISADYVRNGASPLEENQILIYFHLHQTIHVVFLDPCLTLYWSKRLCVGLHKWLWNSVWLVINILLFAIWSCGVLASTKGLLVESLVQLTMQAPQTQQPPSSNQPYATTSSVTIAQLHLSQESLVRSSRPTSSNNSVTSLHHLNSSLVGTQLRLFRFGFSYGFYSLRLVG